MIKKKINRLITLFKLLILKIIDFLFLIFGKKGYLDTPNGRLYLNENDPTSTRIILGSFERKETEILLYFSRKEDCFVDVGCNIGFYSFLLSSKVSNVFSIDPFNRNLEKLSKTISYNKIRNINLIEAAASSGNNQRDFLFCKYSGLSHIKPYKFTKNQEISKYEKKINTFKIDDLELDQDLIFKIDVEGYEMEVLKGMKKTLESQKIRLIMIELYDDYLRRYNSSISELDLFLNSYGYFRIEKQIIYNKLVKFPIHNNYFYSNNKNNYI